MSNIIITGATGFVGSNLARQLLKTKHQIHVFTNKKSNFWRIDDIKTRLTNHIVDLNKPKLLRKKILEIKPEFIYHCATYGIKPTQKKFSTLIHINLNGTVNLLEAATESSNLVKLVNLSSSFEYGRKLNSIKENEIAEPITPYGISKLAQTNFVRYYAIKKKTPCITMRLFTPYGKFDEPGRLITDIMTSLVKQKSITLFSKNAKRDFIHIDDTVSALTKAANSKFVNGEIFNVGSGMAYSVEQIIALAKKITKIEIDVNWKNQQREFDKLGGGGYSNLNKISRKLGWKPDISIKVGLLKSYNWYKKHIELYE